MNQNKLPRHLYPASDEADGAQEHEQRGWDAYRRWMATMKSAPTSQRASGDPSIYSWKGYQTWADRIRQSWKSEEG